jgi:hypothetical protein
VLVFTELILIVLLASSLTTVVFVPLTHCAAAISLISSSLLWVFVSVLVSVDVIVKLGYSPLMVVAPAPFKVTVWSGAALLNSVPLNVKPVPAEYVVFVSVLVSVDVIVKLGYSPLMVVAPLPVKLTVWSGAAFENVVPVNVIPDFLLCMLYWYRY